jgi:transcription termination/antitermination protein NusA
MSVVDLSAAAPEDVSRFLGKSMDDAKKLIQTAVSALEDENIKKDIEQNEEIISASALPSQSGFKKSDRAEAKKGDDASKFSDAERRLREELAAFKLK